MSKKKREQKGLFISLGCRVVLTRSMLTRSNPKKKKNLSFHPFQSVKTCLGNIPIAAATD